MKIKSLSVAALVLGSLVLTGCTGKPDEGIIRVQKAKPWGANQETYQQILTKNGSEFCKSVLWEQKGEGDKAIVTARCVLGDPSVEFNALLNKATKDKVHFALTEPMMGEDSADKMRQESQRLKDRIPDRITADLQMSIKDDLVKTDKGTITFWKDGEIVKVKPCDPTMILYNALVVDKGVLAQPLAREQFLTDDHSDLKYYEDKILAAGNN
ncbi:hypothetical protein [Photobacterium damselae]|uniref:hypothetical protein n=1 Tax=Photobacterium damselae TaxID=38293 RepID=UPI001F19C59B|nr:hypothetical protein [Photobacterium damselae]UKA04815.1 hypothetical protein IHC89_21470 [Photobacterium damselae subsp. damselae]